MLFYHTVYQFYNYNAGQLETVDDLSFWINKLFQMIFEQILQVRRQIWDNISQQHLLPFLTTALQVSLLESQAKYRYIF